MILIVIFLLFIILSILWFLVVRNVNIESFPEQEQISSNDELDQIRIKSHDKIGQPFRSPERSRSPLLLKFKDKYIQGEKTKPLILGKNRKLAMFFVLDSENSDGIRLESSRYPGYLIGFDAGKWRLLSRDQFGNSRKTIVIPLGINRPIAKKNIHQMGGLASTLPNRFGLVNPYSKQCLTVINNRIQAREYLVAPKRNQLITIK